LSKQEKVHLETFLRCQLSPDGVLW